MPHHTRQNKPKRKKPKRSQPLGISDPEVLLVHRELQVLRIAGGAKPGAHKDELMAKRLRKLSESEKECEGAVTEVTLPRKKKPKRARPTGEALARRINALPRDKRLDAIKDVLQDLQSNLR